MQVGLALRNKQSLESQGASGLVSAGAQAHPCPFWAPSELLETKLRERIQPRISPLVIGEEKEMFAYVLHNLRLP